jgi:DNA-binding winged helix-turn-helix (wHTH) protein
MPSSSQQVRVICFGMYELDLAARELRRDGARVKLQDRPFDVLVILIERAGEVVSREEFRQRLWPADTFVDFDPSLNTSINKLRQALSDDADNPRFIATAGRRGYRFIAPITVVGAPLETGELPITRARRASAGGFPSCGSRACWRWLAFSFQPLSSCPASRRSAIRRF